MEAEPRTGPVGSDRRIPGRTRDQLRRHLPPARVVWIALVILGIYGSQYLQWINLPTLVALPLLAVVVDLGFQTARFPKVRFPDAAIATGLFVALILPPLAPLVAAGGVTVAGIAGRHLLRWKGRPLLNPAASTVVLGSVAFGLAPAWWVGIGSYGLYLMIALGVLVLLRTPSSWRFPALFLLTYGLLTLLQHSLLGAATSTQIVLLEILDPATLFFALFMVSEPRSAPAPLRSQVVYAALMGMLAAFLPLWLPSLGILVSLLGANLLGLALRGPVAASSAASPRPSSGVRDSSYRARRARPPVNTRWSVGTRVGAGLLVVAVLVATVAIIPPTVTSLPPGGTGSGGSGGVTMTDCTKDNPAIPASTLKTLHQMLGPSVILSYDSSTGVVKFYDPVNHVTVTETDLYEDYGFAEFNGDDYAVSGCSP